MKLKKSLQDNKEIITPTELAEYVFQSRKYFLNGEENCLDKSDLEKGKLGHEKLEEPYNYLKANSRFSTFKYCGWGLTLLSVMLLARGIVIIPLQTLLVGAGGVLIAKDYIVAKKSTYVRAQLGIGEGKIVYTDLKTPGEVLQSKRLRLAGKPDAVKKIGWLKHVPIEHKTGNAPGYPHQHHKVQLLASCVLVEENFPGKVPHGILSYSNGSFEIRYTKEELELVRNLIGRLKADRVLGRAKCRHGNSEICFKCSMASVSGISWKKERL